MELSDSDDDVIATPLALTEAANLAISNLLPEKSKAHYEKTYRQFKEWCEKQKAGKVTETVLLAYLEEKSKTVKASTLWSTYSMLKATLIINENLDIKKFKNLLPYLKKKSVGHSVKRSQVFTKEQINRFLTEAHDSTYLMMKIVLIMGIAGTCRRDELTQMTIDDVEDGGSVLIVKVRERKINTERTFAVSNPSYCDLYRKYVALRPSRCSNRRLFLKYNRGKCINQVVGINTIGAMPSMIAEYLQLPNPKAYTGHCFRRTSIALLANAGCDVCTVKFKRYGGFVEQSIEDKIHISNTILNELANTHKPSTSTGDSKMGLVSTGVGDIYSASLPNIPARDLRLPCPARYDKTEEFVRRQRALTILKHLCPSTLTVRDLYPSGGGSNGCSWRVEYDVRTDVPELSDDRTVEELHGRLPFYAKITWEEKTCLPPCWNVEYTIIRCDCGGGLGSIKSENNDLDFDYLLNTDIKIEPVTIKQENFSI